tara:strand:- start:256 stop:1494 length:1239 start_codon:yes stop_codon:yes gene_type:complete
LTAERTPSPETGNVSIRTVLVSIVCVWSAYFLLISARGWLIGLDFEFDLVSRRVAVTVAAMGVTFILWLIIRLFDNRSLALQICGALIFALPAALLIAQSQQWLFASIQERYEAKIAQDRGISLRRDDNGNLIIEGPVPAEPKIGEPLGTATPANNNTAQVVLPDGREMDRWLQLIEMGLDRYFLLLAWAALYFALLAGARVQAAERRGERFRSAAKAAELRSLRYQVNPHFLFNTLNSLSALVMTGKEDRAEEMIQSISRFYRHSLADDSTGDVSLEDEIDLQEHYLEIEAVRFPKRLKTRVDLPDELAQLKVPGMILQPLVENSVKYGVSASNRPVTISIVAREEGGRLVLRVGDNGPGLPFGHTGGFGIGLANVRDRLEARFGREASINSGQTPDGYETELKLPMVKHG